MILLSLTLLSLIAIAVGNKLHFFDLQWRKKQGNRLCFYHLVISFFIYVALSIATPIVTYQLLKPLMLSTPVLTGVTLFVNGVLLLLALGLFAFFLPASVKKSIFGFHFFFPVDWKKIWFGCFAYLIALPITTLITYFITTMLETVYPHYQEKEQLAILHLKMIAHSFPLLMITIVLFVIIGPIIEEFLFRGILQNWLKNHCSRLWAVTMSAIIFALFHFSYLQGMTNLPLLFTLTALGFLLGFVYEKQGSILTPIALHMTVNACSTMAVVYQLLNP